MISVKGIYVLLIRVNEDTNVKIGSLGDMTFRAGWYAYVGTAQKVLEKRIQRHMRREKRLFWHIDYLLNNKVVKVEKAFYKEGTKAEECQVARRISEKATVVKGFGCSDCNCTSHLLYLQNGKIQAHFLQMQDFIDIDSTP